MFSSQPCIAAKQAVQHQNDGGVRHQLCVAQTRSPDWAMPCLDLCLFFAFLLVKAGSTPALGITMEAGFSI